ncbi:MAG: hypothetical protein IJ690_04460 [Clostridia bacterium]|nr:hypothetical protein [Clostridia bacterium]
MKAHPKAKFKFKSNNICEKAIEKLESTHPYLQTSVANAKDGSVVYLFVESRSSTIFDINVRDIIENAGGIFVNMVR